MSSRFSGETNPLMLLFILLVNDSLGGFHDRC